MGFGIRNPTKDWNQESSAWNSESKTALNVLTWGDHREFLFACPTQLADLKMILFWTEQVKRKQKLLTDHKRNYTQNVI